MENYLQDIDYSKLLVMYKEYLENVFIDLSYVLVVIVEGFLSLLLSLLKNKQIMIFFSKVDFLKG